VAVHEGPLVSHVLTTSGVALPLAELAALVHARDTLLAVDSAQAPRGIAVDLLGTGADVLHGAPRRGKPRPQACKPHPQASHRHRIPGIRGVRTAAGASQTHSGVFTGERAQVTAGALLGTGLLYIAERAQQHVVASFFEADFPPAAARRRRGLAPEDKERFEANSHSGETSQGRHGHFDRK
jgi:hypothetical protein